MLKIHVILTDYVMLQAYWVCKQAVDAKFGRYVGIYKANAFRTKRKQSTETVNGPPEGMILTYWICLFPNQVWKLWSICLLILLTLLFRKECYEGTIFCQRQKSIFINFVNKFAVKHRIPPWCVFLK